jgi:thymidylate synthase (FAD)
MIDLSQQQALYIDHMGSDISVVKAAKVSFANDDDVSHVIDDHVGLINYLAKHHHWTPFAHTSITLRLRSPVPIRTQCFKHKSGFVENEESRRYISSDPTFFIPDEFRSAPTNGAKQGSGEPLNECKQGIFNCIFNDVYQTCFDAYQDAIRYGVCPEQARFLLPQGTNVNWYWTGSLAAFARFYGQRTDSHAQVEIQELAVTVGNLIEPLFPVSWAALTRKEN